MNARYGCGRQCGALLRLLGSGGRETQFRSNILALCPCYRALTSLSLSLPNDKMSNYTHLTCCFETAGTPQERIPPGPALSKWGLPVFKELVPQVWPMDYLDQNRMRELLRKPDSAGLNGG